ncbi:transposon-transfer assisting family protein [Faecalibacterium sp.]|uniref:transposon-transfer assisting family protein n=1 Tax=Faecalibacterium sp. TaxID=1971605 RepID=UPI0025C21285|nr:transposon-transfer assisting family protein [Faecalibacterium sp.]
MNFNGEELTLMMLYNSGSRLGLMQELRLMQCYLLPDETALRELSEGVIKKLKLMTDAEFAELKFPLN